MEDENATITNNKHRKKRIVLPLTTLPIGGEGGIAGLLVFGGALAIGGVMAAMSLSNNKRKAKAKGTIIHHQPKPQQLFLDNDDGHNIEDNHQTTQTHIQLANVTWYVRLFTYLDMSFVCKMLFENSISIYATL